MKNIDWQLYVITDASVSMGRSHSETAALALEGGAGVIQLRDKELSAGRLVEEGEKILTLTREKDALFIVNDRLDAAMALEADGIHLGQEDLPLPLARRIAGPEMIIGATVRNLEQARLAQEAGADYLGVGAVFPSSAKATAPVIGLNNLREVKKAVSIPVVAIGGITLDNLFQVIEAGADGAAVVSAVVGAQDITAQARKFKLIWHDLQR